MLLVPSRNESFIFRSSTGLGGASRSDVPCSALAHCVRDAALKGPQRRSLFAALPRASAMVDEDGAWWAPLSAQLPDKTWVGLNWKGVSWGLPATRVPETETVSFVRLSSPPP